MSEGKVAGRIEPASGSVRFSVRQSRAVAALVEGAGMGAAAARARVTTRTLRRWRERPDFAAAVEAGRDAAFAEALASLRRTTSRAVAVVAALMRPRVAPETRLKAARVVIGAALRTHESLVLERRITELERLVVTGRRR